jgi:predicted exporter
LPRLPALNAAPAIRVLSFIGNIRSYVQAHQTLRYGLIAGILVITASSVFFLKSNDDIRNLQSMDQKLKLEDQYIRDKFVQQQGSNYFVVHGRTPDEMLKNEQQLVAQLKQLQNKDQLVGFQALAQWLPSEKEQHDNVQLLMQIPRETLQSYADAIQLNVNDLIDWQNNLAQQPILNFQVFSSHPLAFLQMNPTTRLVMLQDIKNLNAVQSLETDNVQLLRPVDQLSTLFEEHRIHAQWLLLVALALLACGLGMLYGYKAILPLVLPVTMALMTTFAIQAWLGVEINLFSIMGTFLIIGIGVDYAIFYRHGHDHPQVVGMALFLCMMSTFLGFGLLSFSQTYAIHCFGLTVLLGVVFAFIYATLFTQSDDKHAVLQQYNQKTKQKV